MKKAIITGAAAVAAADLGSGMLPALPLAGINVTPYAAAIAGAYIGGHLSGGSSLGHAAVSGIVAMLGAMVPGMFNFSIPLGPVDAARLAGGALGVLGAHKLGLEKGAA